MSLGWFGVVDKTKRYSPRKTRLPTQSKTKRHRCFCCPATNARRYRIGTKEHRWLCPTHYEQWRNQFASEKIHWLKASQMSTLSKEVQKQDGQENPHGSETRQET
jgi:hypothetical protein